MTPSRSLLCWLLESPWRGWPRWSTTPFAISLCLVYTWSRGAWLSIIVALLIYFLIYSRKTAYPALLWGVCPAFSAAFAALDGCNPLYKHRQPCRPRPPTACISGWARSTWRATCCLSGLGSGMGVFAAVYPRYTLSGIEAAPPAIIFTCK